MTDDHIVSRGSGASFRGCVQAAETGCWTIAGDTRTLGVQGVPDVTCLPEPPADTRFDARALFNLAVGTGKCVAHDGLFALTALWSAGDNRAIQKMDAGPDSIRLQGSPSMRISDAARLDLAIDANSSADMPFGQHSYQENQSAPQVTVTLVGAFSGLQNIRPGLLFGGKDDTLRPSPRTPFSPDTAIAGHCIGHPVDGTLRLLCKDDQTSWFSGGTEEDFHGAGAAGFAGRIIEEAKDGRAMVLDQVDTAPAAQVETMPTAGGPRPDTGAAVAHSPTGKGRATANSGFESHDTLLGSGGDDTLLGGDGDDLLISGAGADVLDGGAGFDTVSYQWAHRGVEVFLGFDDPSSGAARGDTFRSIEGFVGSRYRDIAVGTDGTNIMAGGAGSDSLFGMDGADTLSGGAGQDKLWGEGGDDVLYGGKGRDHLLGDVGDDVLLGGAGLDKLSGGAGADRFVWTRTWESGLWGEDMINDFVRGADRLDVTMIFHEQLGSVWNGQVSTDFTGAEGAIRFVETARDTRFQLDANGDRVADLSVFLLGVTGMDSSDLVPFV